MKLLVLLLISCACGAQEISIYSEFLRFNPQGEVVAQDREWNPREILSPAVPRNGHLSVHVVVTAPAGTNYFLYAGQSPSDIVQIRVYREHFVPCGVDYCPEWLTEQRLPAFGAMPESISRLPGQTTRCYLFDIWVPPDVPPRRVRVEALLKVGYWLVAPMELRVIAPVLPDTGAVSRVEDIAPMEARSSDTAQRQLVRYLYGLPPEFPPGILRVRDILQRNAAEDMLVAKSMGVRNPQLDLMSWTPFVFPRTGAEWYLRVRDFIYRYTH
ncbi:MAG: hypothetical protein ABUS49_01615 [Acidobacteriota bacterium]